MNRENALVLDWEQAVEAGPQVAGGKGWNLARLARYGFRVPQGVVLAAAAYEAFIDFNKLRGLIMTAADRLTGDELSTPAGRELLSGLRNRIREGDMPPEVISAVICKLAGSGLGGRPLAVRSSATHEDGEQTSFAGIHDSFLNVQGLSGLLAAVINCYVSLWSERAVAYRRRMEISDYDLAPAVVLMEMVQAESSGVAFSCDPLNGRGDRLVIAANFGLGESVVGGRIEPDQYLLAYSAMTGDLQLLECHVGSKRACSVPLDGGGTAVRGQTAETSGRAVLNAGQAMELARLTRQVLLCFGQAEQHQDIEWAYDGSCFHLLQARPVTALPDTTYPALRDQPHLWSNANFRDAVPMVQTPFNWSVSRLLVEQVFVCQYAAAGYRIDLNAPRFRLFNGRPYFNLAVLQWEAYDAFGLLPKEYNRFIGGHQPEILLPEGEPLKVRLRRLAANLRLLRVLGRVRRHAGNTFHEFTRRVDGMRSRDLKGLDDAGLLALVREMEQVMRPLDPIITMLGTSGAVFMTLQPLLERFLPGRGQALTTALLAGQEGITSADHGLRLLQLAQTAEHDPEARAFFSAEPFQPHLWQKIPIRSPFRREFAQFLDQYGHRCVYELDFSNPRWHEDQTWLLTTIKGLLGAADPDAVRKRQQETAGRAWDEIRSNVPYPLHGLVRRLARMGGRDAANREMAKSVLVRLADLYRKIGLELGRRLTERGLLALPEDVFFCYWSELLELLSGTWDGCGLAMRVADRRAQHDAWVVMEAPDLIRGDTPHRADQPAGGSADLLTGLGVSSGQARGVARLIRHPDEGERLQKGDVLVAPSTDPAWTPLFLKASALVAETGGFISHGAIVAREYGIPAVVNVAGALSRIDDGRMLAVDGDHGTVGLGGEP